MPNYWRLQIHQNIYAHRYGTVVVVLLVRLFAVKNYKTVHLEFKIATEYKRKKKNKKQMNSQQAYYTIVMFDGYINRL